MNFTKYTNTLPYPSKRDFTTYIYYSKGQVVGKFAARNEEFFAKRYMEEKVVDEASYTAARKIYDDNEGSLITLFKKDLLEDLGITDHPKADKLYDMAWEDVHSAGLEEVYNVALDLVELLS